MTTGSCQSLLGLAKVTARKCRGTLAFTNSFYNCSICFRMMTLCIPCDPKPIHTFLAWVLITNFFRCHSMKYISITLLWYLIKSKRAPDQCRTRMRTMQEDTGVSGLWFSSLTGRLSPHLAVGHPGSRRYGQRPLGRCRGLLGQHLGDGDGGSTHHTAYTTTHTTTTCPRKAYKLAILYCFPAPLRVKYSK